MSSVHAHTERATATRTVTPGLAGPRAGRLRSRTSTGALRESAGVAEAGPKSPVRAWREELAVALESLTYARAVLSADFGILRHRQSGGPEAGGPVVEELSQAMSSRPWGKGWSAPSRSGNPTRVDRHIFARSDGLMSTHSEMSRVDLSSPDEVARVIGDMEAQLAELTLRQEAVGGRLREIRAAIVRRYRDGAVTAEDWLG
jgi:hypothetical protein